MKLDKASSIIYADIESLIKRIDGWKNNFEKSSTPKVCEHIPLGNSMFTIWTFDGIENKLDEYRCEYYMKKFCESLGEHEMRIINFEKKKMIPLTNKQQESYGRTKHFCIWKISFNMNTQMLKVIIIKDNCHCTGKCRGATLGII